MERWRAFLRVDPIPTLLASKDQELVARTRAELLHGPLDPRQLWESKPASSLLSRQQKDGSWEYRSPRTVVPGLDNNDQAETYRSLGFLVEMYCLDAGHGAIAKAAEFVLSHQTGEGDIRGIYGHQYTPNYTGGFLELLTDAGMGDDPRVRKGLDWLLSVRQQDGGWAIPIRTRGLRLDSDAMRGRPVPRDPSQPSSHLATGMVLRAFAAHPDYRGREEVVAAARLLRSRLFRRDPYPDRGTPDYWERCSFPFWFTDIVSALDTLTRLGSQAMGPEVLDALEWMRGRQAPQGTLRLHLLRGAGMEVQDWVLFAVCRSLERAFRL